MDWSYFSGYFDGEGCLLLGIVCDRRTAKTKGSEIDGWNLIPALSISTGDYQVFPIMEEFLNSEGIRTAKMDLRHLRQNQTKDFMRLSVYGWDNIVECIKRMLPYSIAKKRQLELFLEMSEIKKSMNIHLFGNIKWTKEKWLKIMGKVDEINSLKCHLRGKMNKKYFEDLWNVHERNY